MNGDNNPSNTDMEILFVGKLTESIVNIYRILGLDNGSWISSMYVFLNCVFKKFWKMVFINWYLLLYILIDIYVRIPNHFNEAGGKVLTGIDGVHDGKSFSPRNAVALLPCWWCSYNIQFIDWREVAALPPSTQLSVSFCLIRG